MLCILWSWGFVVQIILKTVYPHLYILRPIRICKFSQISLCIVTYIISLKVWTACATNECNLVIFSALLPQTGPDHLWSAQEWINLQETTKSSHTDHSVNGLHCMWVCCVYGLTAAVLSRISSLLVTSLALNTSQWPTHYRTITQSRHRL